jgi:acetoin utilization deacetylase AcuC-like enzyme
VTLTKSASCVETHSLACSRSLLRCVSIQSDSRHSLALFSGRHEGGAGFCTFNGLVIAAREALAAGARSVLILDLDAHCGGGTRSLIEEEPRIWQVDVSVSSYDRYESSERVLLDIVGHGANYLPAVDRSLKKTGRRGPRFDLCLYNAGMDPYENCSTGGMPGITREVLAGRERMVFDWCQDRHLPVAFVLAGGYIGSRLDRDGLVGLHRLTLSSAAEAGLIRQDAELDSVSVCDSTPGLAARRLQAIR